MIKKRGGQERGGRNGEERRSKDRNGGRKEG